MCRSKVYSRFSRKELLSGNGAYQVVPTLTGENLVLRPPRDGDVEARVALGNDTEILEMYGVSAVDVPAYTRDMAIGSVQSIAENPYGWIIEFQGKPAGSISLHSVEPHDRRASLAIGLWDKCLLGKGLGTQAILLVLHYAFNSLRLHRVGVRVLSYNSRAIRAYEKCGFVVEGRERETAFVNGIWHDDIMLGLLESEFADRTGSAKGGAPKR